MPVRVRLDPERLSAPAGSDVSGGVVLDNPGNDVVRVRVHVSGSPAGWASIEPDELWLHPGQERTCTVQFRLPRGAPGGTGSIPFTIQVLSDQQGAGGESAEGRLVVEGQSELALRLLPQTSTGTFGSTARVAVDNLSDAPARAQFVVDAPDSVSVTVEPDSVVVEPDSTTQARLRIRPRRRFLAGPARRHAFWVRLEPLGGARISTEGAMTQRPLVARVVPAVVGLLALVATSVWGAARVIDDGGETRVASLPPITTTPETTTTVAPSTTLAPEPDPVAAQPTTTAVPPAERRIAFQSKRDGNFEIYTAKADGSDPQNLTQHPAHDSEPAWSPNHLRLAFDSNRGGNYDIYVMNHDGTGLVQLTFEPAPDGYPSWSPDGTRIAFVSFRDGNSEIYVMNADGTEQTRLTKNLADDSRPVWSPDGTKIAFHTSRDGNYEIYVMNVDGSDPKNLTSNGASDQNPAWAPNGARIAFDSTRDDSRSEIYLMGADGSLPTRLTDHDALDKWPVFSPDGARVAFQTDRDSDLEIYVVGVGGGAARRLTDSPGDDAEPAW